MVGIVFPARDDALALRRRQATRVAPSSEHEQRGGDPDPPRRAAGSGAGRICADGFERRGGGAEAEIEERVDTSNAGEARGVGVRRRRVVRGAQAGIL